MSLYLASFADNTRNDDYDRCVGKAGATSPLPIPNLISIPNGCFQVKQTQCQTFKGDKVTKEAVEGIFSCLPIL